MPACVRACVRACVCILTVGQATETPFLSNEFLFVFKYEFILMGS